MKIFLAAIFVALIVKNVDEEKSEVEKQGLILMAKFPMFTLLKSTHNYI